MTRVKDQILKTIKRMPQNATIDDIMEVLHFRMQVDQRLKELNEGKGISHELAETILLSSIPGMKKSIKTGMKTPVNRCSKKLKW